MPKHDIEQMSNDELWALHLEVSAQLTARLVAQIETLEKRLRQLHWLGEDSGDVSLENKSARQQPGRP
jgi:hypothetical protein